MLSITIPSSLYIIIHIFVPWILVIIFVFVFLHPYDFLNFPNVFFESRRAAAKKSELKKSSRLVLTKKQVCSQIIHVPKKLVELEETADFDPKMLASDYEKGLSSRPETYGL